MKRTLLARWTAVAGLLLLPAGWVAAQEQPDVAVTAAMRIVPLGIFPLPDRIVEFGRRTEGSVRVIVFGEIKHPGIYQLPPGSVVRDALAGAGGTAEFALWSASCLLRPINAGQAGLMRFTRKTKMMDLDLPLEEGDRLYLGSEAY